VARGPLSKESQNAEAYRIGIDNPYIPLHSLMNIRIFALKKPIKATKKPIDDIERE